MSIIGRAYGYSKVEKEDSEERIHRRAQFLIYKALEQADSIMPTKRSPKRRRRVASFLSIRISKLKIRIGKRLKRLRKSFSGGSSLRLGLHKKVFVQLSSWFHGGGQVLVKLPPVFTC